MASTKGLVKVGCKHLDALGQDLAVYKHSSGIRVALCKIPGPLCQADIIVATECTNDGGLPHCLEHLVPNPPNLFLRSVMTLHVSKVKIRAEFSVHREGHDFVAFSEN